MKISICDPCKKEDNVITETERYMKVRNRRDLRLDICPKHALVVKGMTIKEYEQYVYKIVLGVDLEAMPTPTIRVI